MYLYPEQLQKQLANNLDYHYFILFGNDNFLLNETKNCILQCIKSKYFCECFNFSIDNKSIWNTIYEICKMNSLFNHKKKILLLSGSMIKIDSYIMKKIFSSISYTRKDVLTILMINKFVSTLKFFLNTQQENIKKHILCIDCNTPKDKRLTSWIFERTKSLQITLDKSAYHLISSHCKNNLSELNQILYQLSINYHKKNLNIQDIKNVIYDTFSCFSLTELIDSILIGDEERLNYIFKQFRTENILKPLTILHAIQNIIILLITLKRHALYDENNLIFLFNKYKIPKNSFSLFNQALNRLMLKQLYQVITLLVQMELTIYRRNENLIWHNFKLLTWLLCRNIVINNKNLTNKQ